MIKTKRVVFYLIIIVICVIVLFPFYWLINTSLQPSSTLYDYPPKFSPTKEIFSTYFKYIQTSKILLWLRNSFFVSIGSTIISTLLAIPSAYAISRLKFRAKVPLIFLILITQMLPLVLLVIPMYIYFSRIGLVNSLFGLLFIYAVITTPIGIWFLKGFIDTIPLELEEAAMIDGCTRIGTLKKVILPIAFPGIIATGVWSFAVAWDEYLFAYTLLNNENLWVVSVGLSSHIGQWSTSWGDIMAGAALGTLPIVILFLIFQRFLLSGLTAGAVKQ